MIVERALNDSVVMRLPEPELARRVWMITERVDAIRSTRHSSQRQPPPVSIIDAM
jgi:hypothetical protein